MKTPRSNPDADWKKLLRQARADEAPATDLPALLRAVREAPIDSRNDVWLTEFSALFASPRFVTSCFGCASALAVFATWQAWDVWDSLPWAQMILGTGGMP